MPLTDSLEKRLIIQSLQEHLQRPAVDKDFSTRQKRTLSLVTVQSLSFFWISRFRMWKLHSFKEFLNSIGDSIVLVADDEIVKVHVHTNHPGLAFEQGTYLWFSYPV